MRRSLCDDGDDDEVVVAFIGCASNVVLWVDVVFGVFGDVVLEEEAFNDAAL